MSHDLIQKAVTALEWVNDNCPDEMPIVDEALFDLRDELAKPAPQGWYCAHCERGVDPSEVTFNEAHEACGRIITNDEPPAAKPAAVPGCLQFFMQHEFWQISKDNYGRAMLFLTEDQYNTIRAMLAAPQPPAPAVDVEAVQNGWSVQKKDDQYFVSESRHGDLLRGAWVDSDSVLKLYFDAHNHLGGPNKKVDVEAVRGTIFRMKDNHKLRESRCKPDPLISIWANELARAIGDEK